MSWVRRTMLPDAEAHKCEPPTAPVFVTIPAPPPPPKGWQGHEPPKAKRMRLGDRPVGEWNDLWRCDACGALWRVGNTCDYCDPSRPSGRCRRGGYHSAGHAWRPATWWQKRRNHGTR